MSRKCWPVLILLSFFLAAASPLSAQTFRTVYPVKFVCGFVNGNVPLLTNSNTGGGPIYEDLKPGNYATVVNGFHTQLQSDTLQAWAVADNLGPALVASFSFVAFETFDIGCPEIMAALGQANGLIVEGWLLLFATSPSFNIQPVYSYSSQNAFWDHELWQIVNDRAVLVSNPHCLPIFPSLFPPIFVTPCGVAPAPRVVGPPSIAGLTVGTGAGGLGLGASIDVEEVSPVNLNNPVVADALPDLIRHLDTGHGGEG